MIDGISRRYERQSAAVSDKPAGRPGPSNDGYDEVSIEDIVGGHASMDALGGMLKR